MSNNHFIVGLGGTGGKVIRELRKIIKSNEEIIESKRKPNATVTTDARFEFAYVDTSNQLIDEVDKWEVLGQDCRLTKFQHGIYTAAAVKPMLQSLKQFPGIRDWIEPRDVFSFIDESTTGASQKRKLGRLLFAQNASDIVSLFQGNLNSLKEVSKTAQATIHVVCGLAGGTGSGFIVDAVAQLRTICRDVANYPILIYALLPDEGSPWAKSVGGHSTYYANGYAALAELNAMGARLYDPINVTDGQRMSHTKYFNGCYLISNVNENKRHFDVASEVPKVIAEFIYQKAMNTQWDGLKRAERGENDTNFIEIEDGRKARAKLFMSFGIRRVVVPEQEIKEFIAYSFAEQATRQLLFNNFLQGEGYADKPVRKDWDSECRNPDVLQRLLISNAHLQLDVGILEDDAKAGWKPIQEYWMQIGATLDAQIKEDKTLEESDWIVTLNNRMTSIFDETYRRMGGVREFYKLKDQARLGMAKHIVSVIEKEFFQKWKLGEMSLMQLRLFNDAIIASLGARKKDFEGKAQSTPTKQEGLVSDIQAAAKVFNGVGIIRRLVTDKRDTLFSEIREKYQALFSLRTQKEGYSFAIRLIPLIVDELIELGGRIDQFYQQLELATTNFNSKISSRLRLDHDNKNDGERKFDKPAIEKMVKAMIMDEKEQEKRTRAIRESIISLAGVEIDGFEKLAQKATVGALLDTLSQQSASITKNVHLELAKSMTPVLGVNIVERLYKEFGDNPKGMRDFVSDIHREAGRMIQIDTNELGRSIQGNESAKRLEQTVCILLPDCETNTEFRSLLSKTFHETRSSGVQDIVIESGILTNEIVLINVSSLMPVRFVAGLKYLKTHYDALLKIANESVLLHGEGNGDKLPPLLAREDSEIQSLKNRKPYMLLGSLLGVISDRNNPETGLQEWIVKYMHDGRIRVQVIGGGGNWQEVMNFDQTAEVQKIIEAQVSSRISEDYRHIDKKKEIYQKFNDLVNTRLEAANLYEADAEYMMLDSMGSSIKQLIGIPN